MSDVFEVSIRHGNDIVKYSVDFQCDAKFSNAWKNVLHRAHRHAVVICNCPGLGEKQLAVRHYEETDAFGLARYPLSGEDHDRNCRFYSPNPLKSGRGDYSKGVIDERPDGTMKIRLDVGLTRKAPSAAPVDALPVIRKDGSRKSQPAMRLLGLLHLLWSEADLNQWRPAWVGKRSTSRIHWWLNAAASQINAGKVPLSDVLLVAAGAAGGQDEKRNSGRVAQAIARKSRMLVIAPLATFSPERELSISKKLAISGFHGIPPLFMQNTMWSTVTRRFVNATAAWRSGHRVVAIAQVEPKLGTRGAVANVVDMALMAVTENWIPVDSSYERIIANRLSEQGRAFSKPLRFEADNDVVFPDFILLDTPAEVPMEVFGRTDEAYEARKAEKDAYYRTHYGIDGWWSWNAAADPEATSIPAFPLKTYPAGEASS